jgi:hypothetical protein
MDPNGSASVVAAASKLGAFVSSLLGSPLEEGAGMLQDRLRLARWERQNRLMDRYSEVVRQRNLVGKTCAVAPKFVVPIVEAASLEENDSLQDMWAELLATAGDPSRRDRMRAAFVDILRQIEPADALILLTIFRAPKSPSGRPALRHSILESLGMDGDALLASLDNLIRLRLVASYVEVKEVVSEVYAYGDNDVSTSEASVTHDYGYDRVYVTTLGVHFVGACMPDDQNQG